MNRDQLLQQSFINSVEWLPVVDSTNSFVLNETDRLTSQFKLPLLVGANAQTSGRGRGTNNWWANDGALTFSILLEPSQLNLSKEQWPRLSLTVGLSVCLALQEILPEANFRLKWPNDVYAGDKKVCGVLNEPVPAHPELLVVGIGINMNNSLEDAPPEIQGKATSLTDISGITFNPWDLLLRISKQLSLQCCLLSEESPELASLWKQHCYLTGRSVILQDGNATYEGTCLGIDDDGALRLQTATREARFFAGVIALK